MSDSVAITLEDKYRLDGDRALISGRQALVRLPILQREVDRRRGINSAGLISGYRGSPLGGYDMELWKAAAALKAHDILFQPGLNEDLALTALAGSQQIDFLPGRKVDGVFCIWYGKGPGVDRSGDAIKHANLAGVAPNGGVLLVFGDDHTAKSSTTAHQSDLTLASWGVPILYPASVAEILQMGLAAFALSRFSGLLVGLKLVNETADGTGVLELEHLPEFVIPDMPTPEGGIHIRPEVPGMQQQDLRLVRHKLPRAEVFAHANRLDRIVFGSPAPRFLIATAGKAFADVIAALGLLGLDETFARRLGVGVYKIALLYPLDRQGLQEAAAPAEEIFFVEEKRPHAETQAKALLYNLPTRPRVTGKTTPEGAPLLPADLPLSGALVAVALAERLQATIAELETIAPTVAAALARVRSLQHPTPPTPSPPSTPAPPSTSAPPSTFAPPSTSVPPSISAPSSTSAPPSIPAPSSTPVASAAAAAVMRRPAFCPGCPHNTSTKVPEGSFGATGIGCHSMVLFHRDRNPLPMGQMGAEGANWIGMAPFTQTTHVFQNLGDGTYNHSGSLAIRAAVQAGVNITFKILFNDAVAMTGGQPVEGALTVSRIVQQVRAEAVARVVVVSERPERFAETEPLPAETELRHRDDMAAVQESLRREPGVTVLVYDQTCAAEKRRRRKLHAYPDPDRRLFINSLVCEGCGDCSVESNCLAIQPLETELGRKRRIDQSACNKDFSCVKGFCPSFVTVEGGRPRRKPKATDTSSTNLPEPIVARAPVAPRDPVVPPIGPGFDMVIAGVGGTGVVTVSAILGMAARIEGFGVNLYDSTGLSQKGGQVFSHVRLRATTDVIVPARVGKEEADVLLACDLVAAVQPEALDTIASGKTVVIGSSNTTATADFQVRRDLTVPQDALTARLASSARELLLLPAATLSEELLGDSIAANLLMLGFAWQQGVIPLSRTSIEKAIELNGKAVKANLLAFTAGRNANANANSTRNPRPVSDPPLTLDAFISRRIEDLERYWNFAYGKRYATLMATVRAAAEKLERGDDFAWAVARAAYKVMAYKDEYEVARLYSDGRFRAALEQEFEGVRSLRIHLAPPLFAKPDPHTGRPRKVTFGPWMFPVLKALAALKGLRERPFDPFTHTAERKLERAVREAYLARITKLAATLSPATLDEAVALAQAPLDVRGFGHVKTAAAQALLDRLI